MTEVPSFSDENLGRQGFYDALIRRQLHEFGEKDIKFYQQVLDQMGYRPGDIAIDIGAGMGEDGGSIAWSYRPRVVFLLEPGSPELLDTRYYPLAHDFANRKLSGVELLGAAELRSTISEMANPTSNTLRPNRTYIQPYPGYAEDLSELPDNSVNKLSMINSIYMFDNVLDAMHEAARVLKDDGKGVIVANGPNDKSVFKQILEDTRALLEVEAPEGVKYTAPETVSSKINYDQAFNLATQFFEEVYIYHYSDRMIITDDRKPLYIWSYDSYRGGFQPPLINDGRFSSVREQVLLQRLDEAIEKNGFFEDVIDTAAVFFKKPKKNNPWPRTLR